MPTINIRILVPFTILILGILACSDAEVNTLEPDCQPHEFKIYGEVDNWWIADVKPLHDYVFTITLGTANIPLDHPNFKVVAFTIGNEKEPFGDQVKIDDKEVILRFRVPPHGTLRIDSSSVSGDCCEYLGTIYAQLCEPISKP